MSSMSNYEVRPAKLSDAKAIAEIHASSSRAAFKALFPGEQSPAVPADMGLAYWRDKKTPNTTGEIWAIYAAPSHWGKGVGLALWDAAREGLLEEECNKVTLWIPLGNERALRFHDLAGFKREMTSIKTVPVGSLKVEEIRLKRDLS